MALQKNTVSADSLTVSDTCSTWDWMNWTAEAVRQFRFSMATLSISADWSMPMTTESRAPLSRATISLVTPPSPHARSMIRCPEPTSAMSTRWAFCVR